jgi:hypothetical protein
MIESIPQSPGTVSKILWHFTGGPTWNPEAKRQNKTPKPAGQAYKNLKAILQSRELRVGQYTEVVKVIVPERRKYNLKTRKVEIERNVPVELSAAPVCCLADIPIIHLAYHAYRYGKFAIGFHRDAVLRGGFNPVFYTLPSTRIIQSIYEGFSQLKFIDVSYITSAAWDIESEISNADSDEIDVSNSLSEIEMQASSIDDYVDNAKESFEQFLAFVKTFDKDEFGTIYCEREWRSLKTYQFNFDDVAMIVLPKKVGKSAFFSKFTTKDAETIGLPRSIPIVPWEDLLEH